MRDLRIAVCVRPPELEDATALGRRDLAALEYAIRLARRDGGTVTAVATGGEECLPVLREAIARGADSSVHVVAHEQSADPVETAQRLQQAVADLDPSLVLAGTRSAAGMHGAVPRQLASRLYWPYLGSVVGLEIDTVQCTARVVQALEAGGRWTWAVGLPLVAGVEAELCSPRYLGVRRARRADTHQPETISYNAEVAGSDAGQDSTDTLEVLARVAPRIRPKKSKVATAAMSAADRMKMLRGGGKSPAAGANAGGGDDDQPKRIEGDPLKAAAEIVALLEKREVLRP